jgi:hypothetical protein
MHLHSNQRTNLIQLTSPAYNTTEQASGDNAAPALKAFVVNMHGFTTWSEKEWAQGKEQAAFMSG